MTARELRSLEARYQRALARAAELRLARDEAIRQMAALGHSHAEIYRVLDGAITRARIGQIAHR